MNRKLWLKLAAAAAALVLLALLWRPLVAWFTGKPMGGGTSEEVSSQAGGLTLEAALRPDPPRLEGNVLLLTVRGPDGEPVEDAEVKVEVTMPAMGAMAAMRATADVEEEGDGRYRAAFDLQMAGTWTLEVDVRSGAGAATQRYSLNVGTKGLTPLGGGTAAPARGTAASALAPRILPDASLAPLRDAFAAYEEARKLLAADRAEGLAPHARRLANAFALARTGFAAGDRDVLAWLEDGVQAAERLAAARDLAAARLAFAEVSRTLIGLAQCDPRLAEGWHVFECPMTPGFNKWAQRSPRLENPYMGKAMGSCGSPSQWAVPGVAAAGGTAAAALPHAHGDEVSHYTCSMHPTVRQEGPGTCPICNMDLVPVSRQEVETGTIVLDARRVQQIGVRTGRVVRRTTAGEIRTVGRVALDESRLTDVTVKFAGYIGDLRVSQTGQPVRRGQTLFTLYSPELYAAQQEYLVALRSQRAAQGTAAPDRADYLARAARQKLALWDLSDAQIRQLAARGRPLEQIAVPSPASGFVLEKNVVEGAAVQPGMPLFRIGALDRVWVEAEVYEADLPRVALGQAAVVTLPYQAGATFRGRVSLVLPSLTAESRTARVRVEIPNRSGPGGPLLRPEMYADVLLVVPGREALLVPESAVLYTGPRALVFLALGEGRFRPQEVDLGPKVGDAYEIVSGVHEGDVVVTSGNFLIAAESRLKAATELW